MYIQTLTFDDWKGVQDFGGEQVSPSLDIILSRLQALNGSQYTLIVLSGEGEAHMAIGGGEASRYVVYATFDGQHFQRLHTKHQLTGSGPTVRMVVGGQQGEYPAELAVSLDEALTAAHTFALEGALDPSLAWQT